MTAREAILKALATKSAAWSDEELADAILVEFKAQGFVAFANFDRPKPIRPSPMVSEKR